MATKRMIRTAKPAVKRTLWASRDSERCAVDIWGAKPTLNNGEFDTEGTACGLLVVVHTDDECRKVFGFAPRPGQCIEFELTAKVVK